MSKTKLPSFSLDLKNYPTQLEALLEENLAKIAKLLEQTSFSWDNLIYPLESMEDALTRFFSPLSHLHSVVNSKELRDCYEACLPKLSSYEASIGHNQALYEAISSLDKTKLNSCQKKILNDMKLDFELSGVNLSLDEKQRFEKLQIKLAELENQFQTRVLDATQAFHLVIEDEKRLQGLPSHALATAKHLAEEENKEGWVLSLEAPCCLAVLTTAQDRALREEFYHAYVTRASEIGPQAGLFDNAPLIDEILQLRHEKASLLGFANYASLSLATKMAKSTSQVVEFLMDLVRKSKPQGEKEVLALRAFAKEQGIDELQPWDLSFLAEKMRQTHYSLSQEALRPYFPLTKVMQGLFAIIQRLYGVSFKPLTQAETWHSAVNCYTLCDEEGQERGFIYIDLFARKHKRSGAWMDLFQSRRRLADGSIQLPIASLTCNFAKTGSSNQTCLSHEEVITLFHEMGHCLHHLLTQVDYESASGINGVEWDAVELPSQFFENWCWEYEALQLLSEHKDTHEVLPADLYEKILAAKNFQSAMAMLRQLEFSLFDFLLHQNFIPHTPDHVKNTLSSVRSQTSLLPVAKFNRFQNSFSHIFSGGYAAGYYSYKWAEVLSSDAFSRFEEEGLFNPQTGRDFLHEILEVGSSVEAEKAFKAFRGREPQIEALLRHNGILTPGH